MARLREAFRREPRLKPFAIGLGFFALVSLAVTFKAAFLEPRGNTLLDSFWVSLAASFIEDLIFFAFVGVVSLYLSLQRPSDDVFDSRIKYLFNAGRVNNRLRLHLMTGVEKLGLFSDRYITTITFTSYDAKLDAVKAFIHVERKLVNMFRDRAFSKEPQKITIMTDGVGNPGTVQGHLLSCWIDAGVPEQQFLVEPIDIYDLALRKEMTVDIPANGEVNFNYKFWVWYKNGADYSLEVLRFSERVDVKVESRTDRTLVMDRDKAASHHLLTPESVHLYSLGELPTGGVVAFSMGVQNAA